MKRKIQYLSLFVAVCAGTVLGADRAIVPASNLDVRPAAIQYPTFGHPSVQTNIPLMLQNLGVVPVTINAITPVEDSVKPVTAPSGWLGAMITLSVIAPGDSLAGTLQLNKGGVVTAAYKPALLYGHLLIIHTPVGLAMDTIVLPIAFTVADTVKSTRWDTLATACTKLTIATNGNAGHHGIGGVNMNYASPTECDTGSNSRGNASIYLFDSSPVILRHANPSSFNGSWSMYTSDVISATSFRPLQGFAADGKVTSNSKYDLFNSGTFSTIDSLVKIEKTWYAPKGMADSCKFIIERTRFFPYTIGTTVTNLAIGEAADWDLPSDSNGSWNAGGYDVTRKFVYLRGFNSLDGAGDCRDNNLRYAGMGLLYTNFKNNVLDSTLYGGYNAANDSFVYPEGTFVPAQLWNNMQVSGYSNESRVVDLHSVLVYKNVASTGFTLPANDTLTVWSVLITIPKAATQAAGLDSLQKQYDRAKVFVKHIVGFYPCDCGPGPTRGNVNESGIIGLADLSMLIAYLIGSPRPILPTPASANINASPDGIIDLSDLSLLVAYLTADPRPTLPPCGCP